MKKLSVVFILFSLGVSLVAQEPGLTLTPSVRSNNILDAKARENVGQTQNNPPANVGNSPLPPRPERDPFKPVITPKVTGQVGLPKDTKFFIQENLMLPSTARRLKRIIVEYQAVDGSIQTYQQALNHDIDWHFPLILTQKNDVSKDLPTQFSGKLGNLFQVDFKDRQLKVTGPLELVRDFTLASPNRLILDFQAQSSNIKNLEQTLPTKLPVVTDVALSTHLDFYRITLVLDGSYNYEIIKPTLPTKRRADPKTYTITLK